MVICADFYLCKNILLQYIVKNVYYLYAFSLSEHLLVVRLQILLGNISMSGETAAIIHLTFPFIECDDNNSTKYYFRRLYINYYTTLFRINQQQCDIIFLKRNKGRC